MSKCVASFQNRFPYSCIPMLQQNHAPSVPHSLWRWPSWVHLMVSNSLLLAFGIRVKLSSIHACAWEKHLKVTLVISWLYTVECSIHPPLTEVCMKITQGIPYIYGVRFPASCLWVRLFWDKALVFFKRVGLFNVGLRAAAQTFKRTEMFWSTCCSPHGFTRKMCLISLSSLSCFMTWGTLKSLFSW